VKEGGYFYVKVILMLFKVDDDKMELRDEHGLWILLFLVFRFHVLESF
jgi:hypothetical protein